MNSNTTLAVSQEPIKEEPILSFVITALFQVFGFVILITLLYLVYVCKIQTRSLHNESNWISNEGMDPFRNDLDEMHQESPQSMSMLYRFLNAEDKEKTINNQWCLITITVVCVLILVTLIIAISASAQSLRSLFMQNVPLLIVMIGAEAALIVGLFAEYNSISRTKLNDDAMHRLRYNILGRTG